MAQVAAKKSAPVTAFVDDWVSAVLNGDVDKLSRITTDRAITIGPLGFVLNKEQWLGGFKTGDLKYLTLKWEESTVIDYGDAAIVVGRDKHTVKYKDNVTEYDLRGQLVLVKENGAWKLASQQYSAIREPGNRAD